MATSRPVRIARTSRRAEAAPSGPEPSGGARSTVVADEGSAVDRRKNVGGSQRVLRVMVFYLVVLVALYVGFLLYDRTAPGGGASPESNGVLLFTGLFVAFAAGGAIFTVHPAPRAVEVAADRVTVVGRWGVRRVLPPLDSLSTRVVRRYPSGWLSDTPVEQVELWGSDVPLRTYLVEDGLFREATRTDRGR